ncbi:MAG: DUF1330 domain-containing protein [Erythrobacter sp.]
MPVYLIATIDVEDGAKYDVYRSNNPSLVQAAGGKYIIKGESVTSLEGTDFRDRFVMIEFANEAALRRFYDSPEYAKLKPIRQSAAKSSLGMIKPGAVAQTTAYQIDHFGEDVALNSQQVSLPDLAPTDMRIQPTLISMNPVDWKIRAGFLAVLPFEFPYTLGGEGVGIIEEVGTEVDGFEPGQRVMAFSSLVRGGWYANRVDVSAKDCALVPEAVSNDHAAGLSVPLLTADQTISLHKGDLQRALIIGASGSVGSIATRLLRHRNVEVDAICSSASAARVETLGAKVVPAQETAEGGYDFVLDAAGGPQIENGYRGLAEGGTLVSIVQPVDEERAQQKNAVAVRYSAKPDGARLAELVGQHSIFAEPMIAATLPLAQAEMALQMLQHGRMRGKILLQP